MGRDRDLPGEEEQFKAYCRAIEGMRGLPVTIRTIDIGADKPLERGAKEVSYLNPALGLRAIRWSLSDPDMFHTQLRAILRAATYGPVKIMIPMLAHLSEIRQTLQHIEEAKQQLRAKGQGVGPVQIGAMIEVPAAALMLDPFLRHFDFLSLGTNDLIQYTLAIDRADEGVAHLYDPTHPAVLRLIASTIAAGVASGKAVSIAVRWRAILSTPHCFWGWGCVSFLCTPPKCCASSKRFCVRTPASSRGGLVRCWRAIHFNPRARPAQSAASNWKFRMNARKNHLDWLAMSCLVGLSFFWGFQQSLVRWTVDFVPPVFQVSIRFVLATLCIAVWCRVRGIALFERDGSAVAGLLAGLLFACEFGLLYPALKLAPAAQVTVFLYTSPLWVALLVPLLIRSERLSVRQWAGLLLAFVALAHALWKDMTGSGDWAGQALGNAMALLAGLCWGSPRW